MFFQREAEVLDPVIRDAARRWGSHYRVSVPVPVVKGIIAAESSYRADATRVEPDGRRSIGLMQVLEGTARDMGLLEPRLMYDPTVSIDYGTRYFARQLKRYGGDVRRAVSAYNAGTATARNRSYVEKVLGYARGFGYGQAAFVLAAGVALYALARRGARPRFA